MTTESKKLRTIEGFTPGPWKVGDIHSSVGRTVWRSDGEGRGYLRIARNISTDADAAVIAAAPDLYRIAHEQREVIRLLMDAIRLCAPMGLHDEITSGRAHAIIAAAPYLED